MRSRCSSTSSCDETRRSRSAASMVRAEANAVNTVVVAIADHFLGGCQARARSDAQPCAAEPHNRAWFDFAAEQRLAAIYQQLEWVPAGAPRPVAPEAGTSQSGRCCSSTPYC